MLNFLISFLSCNLPYKSHIILPKSNNNLTPGKLRIEGYYYCVKTITDYCKSVLAGTGIQWVEISRYEQKYISVIVFYTKGQVYHSGGLLISGIDITNYEDYLDHCYQINSKNTFDEAKSEYEELVEKGYLNNADDKQEKGVYNINMDSIKIQV